MIELTPELIRKHKDVVEATVKSHQRTSKKGKIYSVKQHERDVKNMSIEQLNAEIDSSGPMMKAARKELRHRGISRKWQDFGMKQKAGLDKTRKRGNEMRRLSNIKKSQGPDPLSPGQLKKKYGKNVFSGKK